MRCAPPTTPPRCRYASIRKRPSRSRPSCPVPAAWTGSPAPLLLWVHGGPLMSWNSWSWPSCPWVMAARGYAVLLPNPALSQGFGLDFVRRGWGEWGGAPYTDLMAAVDVAVARPEVDGT